MNDAIHVRGVSKRFGEVQAVDGIEFVVPAGSLCGFLGPNGAGKSTTLRMVTGVFPPTAGRASIAGHDVVNEAIQARRSLGYLPERTSLYQDMAVLDYLRFVADMKQIPARETGKAVTWAMGNTGTEHVSHRLIGNLSKGYRQRVGIAQAILGDPSVLILDEPTSGLDPEQVSDIRTLIRGLGDDKRTVVLSTHILPEVEMICSRVIILARGRILAVDEPSRLERRLRPYRELAARVVEATDGMMTALRSLEHVSEVVVEAAKGDEEGGASGTRVVVRLDHGFDRRREIASKIVDSGAGLLELTPVVMTLEEIFLKLVGDSEADVA